MFGAARLRAAAFAVRRFGARFFDSPALRGERDLRAMIRLTPAPRQHAMARLEESRRGHFRLATALRQTSGN
jgi:hypothetical protein